MRRERMLFWGGEKLALRSQGLLWMLGLLIAVLVAWMLRSTPEMRCTGKVEVKSWMKGLIR
jgi:hypothetical protein